MEIDESKIGINVRLELRRVRREGIQGEIEKSNFLKLWLFWKNKEYPSCFIGTGIGTVSRELGITEKEAKTLILLKLKEILPTLEDKQLKDSIEKRIREFTPFKDKFYECRRCGKPFKKTHNWQKNCKSCRAWFKTYGKYAEKPQSQPQPQPQGLTIEERELLGKLRLQE